MMKSDLCVDCICLPVCMTKHISNLINNCCLLRRNLLDISQSMSRGNSYLVYFKDLREVRIKRSDEYISMIYIQTDEENFVIDWR